MQRIDEIKWLKRETKSCSSHWFIGRVSINTNDKFRL